MFINWIQNTPWAGITVDIICVIVAIAVFFQLWGILSDISLLLKAKSSKIRNEAAQISTESFTDFREFYQMIETLVSNEVINLLHRNADANEVYQFTRLDSDVKKISNDIFRGLRIEKFNSMNLPITSEYIMSTIIRMTTRVLTSSALAINKDITTTNMTLF